MTPENAERREKFEAEHAVTDPALHAISAQRVANAVDRAQQVANIASVVTIRTKPKSDPAR